MAEIRADGDKLISCGESIVSLCDEYTSCINTLFDSLSKINVTAWSGSSADSYVAKLPADKKKFTDFGDYLKMYGKVIKNTGDNVNRIIAKWDDK